MPRLASDWDHRIIDATSVALGGKVGQDDDLVRLRKEIENGSSDDKLKTACEIAVAFMRWTQDLKAEKARSIEHAGSCAAGLRRVVERMRSELYAFGKKAGIPDSHLVWATAKSSSECPLDTWDDDDLTYMRIEEVAESVRDQIAKLEQRLAAKE